MMRPAPWLQAPYGLWVAALCAVAGHLLLWREQPLGPYLLPGCMALALLLGRPQLPSFDLVAFLGIGAAAGVTLWGSLSTGSRVWDGFVAWECFAHWLALGRPEELRLLAEPAVYCPARGYPLLQPILHSQLQLWLGDPGGRALFAALHAWLGLTAWSCMLHVGLDRRAARLCVLGLVLLPALVGAGEGGSDSGYAELLMACCLAQVAAAVIRREPVALALATLLLVLGKPEGVVHATIFATCLWWAGTTRLSFSAGLGAALGCLLHWIGPLQVLRTESQVGLAACWLPLLPCMIGAAWQVSRLGTLAAGAASSCWLLLQGFDLPASHVGYAFARMLNLGLNAEALPQIVPRVVYEALHPIRLGLSFVLPVAAAVALRRRRTPLGPGRPLLLATGCGLLAVMVFLTLLDPSSLDSFLRTGVDRYVLQWSGLCWITTGVLLARLQQSRPPTQGAAALGSSAAAPITSEP